MSEMIDAVAKAIEEAMFAPHELPLREELHRKYLDVARAAIAAMREPTDDMWDQAENASILAGGAYDAGHAATFEDAHSFPTSRIWQAVVMWRAMIDEALR